MVPPLAKWGGGGGGGEGLEKRCLICYFINDTLIFCKNSKDEFTFLYGF